MGLMLETRAGDAAAGKARHWDCRCCGYRLGVVTPEGLRVLVAGALWSGGVVIVRCPNPQCRSRQYFDLSAFAA